MPGGNGEEVVSHEPPLGDEELVIRKIPNIHLVVHPNGGRRVSKAAFSASSQAVDPRQGMSVDRLSTIRQSADDPADPLHYAPEFDVLMTLRVGDLRELGLEIVSDPRLENPAHCNVLGVNSGTRKKLLKMAAWLRRPADVDV